MMSKSMFFLSLFLVNSLLGQNKTDRPSYLKKHKETVSIVFVGVINGKIPVELTLKIQDSVVVGYIRYKNEISKDLIQIIGEIRENKYELKEFSKNKSVTGIISGYVASNHFSGTWFSPETREEMKMELTKTKSVFLNNLDLNATNVNGYYTFSYGATGATGTLKVLQKKNGYAALHFFNISDAPARNQASLKIDNFHLVNSMGIFSLNEQECKIKIRFYKNFVIVRYFDNQRDCGFGNNADIEGIYVK